MISTKISGVAMLILGTGLGSCATAEQEAASDQTGRSTIATANLATASGADAGIATVFDNNGALSLSLSVKGVPSGQHGAHVHMTGKCEAPAFASAGGHWNPTQHKHGLDNPQGQHAGDMPNLTVAADGTGTLTYQLKNATRDGLLDADGAAIVIHATVDDQMTDPSGNSGDRIACGVFAAR